MTFRPYCVFLCNALIVSSCSDSKKMSLSGGSPQASIFGTLEENQKKIHTTRRDMDAFSDIFKGLVASERKDRMAEDEKINKRVTNLQVTLADFKKAVQLEITRLDAQDEALKDSQIQNVRSLQARIVAYKEEGNAALQAAVLELEKKDAALAIAIQTVDSQLSSKIALVQENLETHIDDYQSTLTDMQTNITKNQADIVQQMDNLIDMKNDLENTLSEQTGLLASQIKANILRIQVESERLNETQEFTNQLKVNIDKINTKIVSIRKDIKNIDEKSADEREILLNKILSLRQDTESNVQDLRKDIAMVDQKIDRVEQSVRADLGEQMKQMQERIEEKMLLMDEKDQKRYQEYLDSMAQVHTRINHVEVKSKAARDALVHDMLAMEARLSNDFDGKFKELQGSIKSLDEKIEEYNADLKKQLKNQFVYLKSYADTRVNILDSTLRGLMADRFKNVDHRIEALTSRVDNMEISNAADRSAIRQEMLRLNAELKNYTEAEIAAVNANMAKLEERLSEKVSQLRADLTDKVTELKDVFQANTQEMEAKYVLLDSKINNLDIKSQAERQAIVDQLLAIQSKNEEDFQILRNGMKTLEDSMRAEYEKMREVLEGKIKVLDTRTQEAVSGIYGNMKQIKLDSAEEREKIISLLKASVNTINKDMTEQERRSNLELNAQIHRVVGYVKSVDNNAKQKQAELLDQIKGLDTKTKEIIQDVTFLDKKLSSTESKLQEELTSLGDNFEDFKQVIKQQIDSLKTNINSKIDGLDSKFTVMKDHLRYLDVNSREERRQIMEKMLKLGTNMSVTISSMENRLEQKMQMLRGDLATRLDRLNIRNQQDKQALLAQIQNLDMESRKARESLARRIAELQKVDRAQQEAFYSHMSNVQSGLYQAIVDERDARIDALQGVDNKVIGVMKDLYKLDLKVDDQGYQISEAYRQMDQMGQQMIRQMDNLTRLGQEERAKLLAKIDGLDNTTKSLILQLQNLENKGDIERAKLLTQVDGLDAMTRDLVLKITAVDQKTERYRVELLVDQEGIRQNLTSFIENQKRINTNISRAIGGLEKGLKSANTKINYVNSQISNRLDRLDENQKIARAVLKKQLLAQIKLEGSEREKLADEIMAKFALKDQQIEEINQELDVEFQNIRSVIDQQLEKHRKAQEEERLALENKLKGLTGAQFEDVLQQIQTLDERTLVTRAELNARLEASEKKILAHVEDNIDAVVKTLNAQRDLEITNLKNELAQSKQLTTTEINRLNQQITDITTGYGNLKEELLVTRNDLQSFKDSVAQTYATKIELRKVRNIANAAADISKMLDNKLNVKVAELQDLISKENKKTRDDLLGEIGRVEDKTDSLSVKLSAHIQKYNNHMKAIHARFRHQARQIWNTMRRTNNMGKSLKELKNIVITFRDAQDKINAGVKNRLTSIDTQVSGLSDLQKDLQKKYGVVFASVQALRGDMQTEVEKLTKRIKRVEHIANRALRMAKANRYRHNMFKKGYKKTVSLFAKRMYNVEADVKKLDQKVETYKADLQNQIAMVQKEARNLVSDLGGHVQTQFANTTSQLTELHRKQAALEYQSEMYLAQILKQKNFQAKFQSKLTPARKKAIESLVTVIRVIDDVAETFVEAIGPDQKKPDFYNETFIPIMTKYHGVSEASFSNAFGYDNFILLAQEWVRQLVFGDRGSEFDGDLFLGFAAMLPIQDNENLQELVVTNALAYQLGSEEDAIVTVRNWGLNTLFKKGADGDALRKKIAKSTSLKEASGKLKLLVEELSAHLGALEGILKGYKDANKALFVEFQKLAKEDVDLKDMPSLLPSYASNVLEAARQQFRINDREMEYNRMVSMQRQRANANTEFDQKIAVLTAQSRTADAALKSEINKKIAKMETERKVANNQLKRIFQAKLTNLEASVKKATDNNKDRLNKHNGRLNDVEDHMRFVLEMMLAMKDMEGFPTHKVAQLIEVANKAGVSEVLLKVQTPSIDEVASSARERAASRMAKQPIIQHFYDAETLKKTINSSGGYWANWNKRRNPTSSVCTGKTVVKDPYTGGARGYRTRFARRIAYNKCWVNFRGFPRSSALGLAKTIWFRVFGTMTELEIKAGSVSDTIDFWTIKKNQAKPAYLASNPGNFINDVFDVYPTNLANWFGTSSKGAYWAEKLSFTPKIFGKPGKTYTYYITLYSPLVLSFRPSGLMTTLDQRDAQVRFDLNADGTAEWTGWLSGKEGAFLALDKNHNGFIDDGTELFGQASLKQSNKELSSGYEALAFYDSSKDGKIDKDDEVFGQLLVWNDHNVDGKSQTEELRSLSKAGITEIGLRYHKVSPYNQNNQGNAFLFESRFKGPSTCSQEGCKAYDVFFLTGHSSNRTVAKH